jgi:hypothetical protein
VASILECEHFITRRGASRQVRIRYFGTVRRDRGDAEDRFRPEWLRPIGSLGRQLRPRTTGGHGRFGPPEQVPLVDGVLDTRAKLFERHGLGMRPRRRVPIQGSPGDEIDVLKKVVDGKKRQDFTGGAADIGQAGDGIVLGVDCIGNGLDLDL